MPNRMSLKPFVKWVGGKRKIIKDHLEQFLPDDFSEYWEPFVGGGAMLLALQPTTAHINDLNSELITTYQIIKNQPNNLMNQLDEMLSKHNQEYFLKVRAAQPTKSLDVASRFIYLNKTCFNGLYRVNSNGQFNVPFNGKTRDKLVLYEEENINDLSNYFNTANVTFDNMDYLEFLNQPKAGDFVFLDPPYDCEPGTTSFVAYQKEGFGTENQKQLADKLKELDKQGVKWMVTNHATTLIKELFKDFHQYEFDANRSISCKGENRKNGAREIVIWNY